jgi:hypothetical protein
MNRQLEGKIAIVTRSTSQPICTLISANGASFRRLVARRCWIAAPSVTSTPDSWQIVAICSEPLEPSSDWNREPRFRSRLR